MRTLSSAFSRRLAAFALLIAAISLYLTPLSALAKEFGGQTSVVLPCYNAAIYTVVGPPRGGTYIWTPSTKTYSNGPPTHPGQWLIGLTGVPYICLAWIVPIIVIPGISISMMGSSN